MSKEQSVTYVSKRANHSMVPVNGCRLALPDLKKFSLSVSDKAPKVTTGRPQPTALNACLPLVIDAPPPLRRRCQKAGRS
jgi:hypothetical protein